jgi:hypothetical protein
MTPPQAYLGARRFPRFDVALPVVGRVPQFPDQDLRGTVRNIGRGGLMAEFPVQLVLGSQVTLTLHTRNGFLQETGRVVWAARTGGTIRHGMAFLETKERDYGVGLFPDQPAEEG